MKPIWFRVNKLEEINHRLRGTLVDHLGIMISEIAPDSIHGTLQIDSRTRQPNGILHGGASVALAETLASIGANLVLDEDLFYSVGQEINANHLKMVTDGYVKGIASPLHIGKNSQVWNIRILNDKQELTCVARMTR